MDLFNRLKQIRKRLNLSQADMAGKLGIATSTYQHYERGEREMPASVLKKITDFGFSPNFILTGEGEMLSVATTVPNFSPSSIERRDYPDMSSLDTEAMQLLLAVLNTRDDMLIELTLNILKAAVAAARKRSGSAPDVLPELEYEKKREAA